MGPGPGPAGPGWPRLRGPPGQPRARGALPAAGACSGLAGPPPNQEALSDADPHRGRGAQPEAVAPWLGHWRRCHSVSVTASGPSSRPPLAVRRGGRKQGPLRPRRPRSGPCRCPAPAGLLALPLSLPAGQNVSGHSALVSCEWKSVPECHCSKTRRAAIEPAADQVHTAARLRLECVHASAASCSCSALLLNYAAARNTRGPDWSTRGLALSGPAAWRRARSNRWMDPGAIWVPLTPGMHHTAYT
jgi:hypothetical protein